jgi:enoyl-CoA hydratase
MEFQTIQVEERAGGIGIVILSRPEKRNALSIQMRREISTCLSNWKNSPLVGVAVFTGAGPAFSAGFDLDEFGRPELFDELLDSSSRYHRDVWYFPKPTIAAVNGPAMAGGFDLATICDIRICSESAVFGHPEIKFGISPLFTPLRWIVGDGLARDLCLSGRKIDAKEAHCIGLVSEIVAGDGLLERALQIAAGIMEAPLKALQFTKGYLVGNAGRGFEESFYVEHDKAIQEFLLKRAPEEFKRK